MLDFNYILKIQLFLSLSLSPPYPISLLALLSTLKAVEILVFFFNLALLISNGCPSLLSPLFCSGSLYPLSVESMLERGWGCGLSVSEL